MSPESSHLLWAVAATTVLLGLGAVAGYYAGMQVVVGRNRVASAIGTSHSATYWSLLNDIDRCTTNGIMAAEQGKELVALGRKQTEPLAAELSAAIEQLAATTRNLAKGLREMQSAARADKPTKQGSARIEHDQLRSAAASRTAEPRPSPLLRQADASLPKACVPLPGIDESALTSAEICEFTGAQATATIEDRRKQRHPYDCLQKLSPCFEPGVSLPPTEMVSVRCHDISVEGISFFWPHQPDFDMAIISLGDGNVLMSIEIRQSKAVFMHGEVQYLVGCRFLKRVDSNVAATRSDARECATA